MKTEDIELYEYLIKVSQGKLKLASKEDLPLAEKRFYTAISLIKDKLWPYIPPNQLDEIIAPLLEFPHMLRHILDLRAEIGFLSIEKDSVVRRNLMLQQMKEEEEKSKDAETIQTVK